VSDGEVRRFAPGRIILVEDLAGKGHASRVVAPQTLNPTSAISGQRSLSGSP
jgi:hypothetical protein